MEYFFKTKIFKIKTILAFIFFVSLWTNPASEGAGMPPAPWQELDRYQNTITRKEFEHLLTRFFNPSKVIYNLIDVNDQRVVMYHDRSKSRIDFVLNFAPNEASKKTANTTYKTIPQLNALKNPPDKPLQGIRIALDPGHIGGKWAGMEERQISWAGYPIIREGDWNLVVSRKVKARLEALGATVFMTHTTSEPVTKTRPETWMAEAAATGKKGAALRRLAEMYFYRRAEIYERAMLLRKKFHPDLSLSLHFNATEDSGSHVVTKDNRHAFFINGAYGSDEVDNEQSRFFMFSKLLERALPMECAMGDFLTEEVLKIAPLKANSSGWTKYTCPLNDNPYNVGRNLAVTRQFPGPTVLCELFFMNNTWTAARMTAGDYKGTKQVAGGTYRSIYEDYTDAVVNAVRRLYTLWAVVGYSKLPPTKVTKSWGTKPATPPASPTAAASSATVKPVKGPASRKPNPVSRRPDPAQTDYRRNP